MKKWTVVIEVTDHADRTGPSAERELTKNEIEDAILSHDVPAYVSYQVMETIPAPYGPQHPDGVFIKEVAQHNSRCVDPSKTYDKPNRRKASDDM